MTQPHIKANPFPCSTSSLHQPQEIDGVFNPNRFKNSAGDCIPAAQALQELGLPETMIQHCPILLEKYKSMGAPESINCIAELMLYANATSD